MLNGEYAVSILFSHKDNFLNGSNQASMNSGRFLEGMERDGYDAILKIDDPIFNR